MPVCMCMHAHVYVYAYVCVHAHVCMPVCMCVYTSSDQCPDRDFSFLRFASGAKIVQS